MNQRSSLTREQRLSRKMNAEIEAEGSETTLNGETVMAQWDEITLESAQRYLGDDWDKEAYMVEFPASALEAPASLAVGVEVVCEVLGYTGIVKALVPVPLGEEVASVRAVVQLIGAD